MCFNFNCVLTPFCYVKPLEAQIAANAKEVPRAEVAKDIWDPVSPLNSNSIPTTASRNALAAIKNTPLNCWLEVFGAKTSIRCKNT